MGNIEELEKYKQLLDSGAINEEEFQKLKQKLLGLKTDEEKEIERQQERNKALAEIEQMKAEQDKMFREQEAEKLAQTRREQEIMYQQTFDMEKAKEEARLEAEREAENKIQREQQERIQNGVMQVFSVMKTIALWIITVCLVLMSIGSFSVVKEYGSLFLWDGIFTIVFAVMACPWVTSKTRNIPMLQGYYKFKKSIVIVLVIIFFVGFGFI